MLVQASSVNYVLPAVEKAVGNGEHNETRVGQVREIEHEDVAQFLQIIPTGLSSIRLFIIASLFFLPPSCRKWTYAFLFPGDRRD